MSTFIYIIFCWIIGQQNAAFGQSTAKIDSSTTPCESSIPFVESKIGKKLPLCQSNSPKFVSHNQLTTALFVLCNRRSEKNCLDIVNEFASASTGAVINILVADGLLVDDLFQRKIILIKSKFPREKINTIKISSGHASMFIRDNVFFERGSANTLYMPKPSEYDTEAIDEAMRACNISKSEYTSNSNQGSYNSVESSGGNFLTLPNGTVVMGRSTNYQNIFPTVLNYFTSKSKLIEVNLPRLRVGHIDEILNIGPNPNPNAGECDFSLIRASPKKMFEFLSANSDIPRYSNIISSDKIKLEQNIAQNIIEESTQIILDEIRGNYNNCSPRIVDLPVLFLEGKSIYPNPANGLYVNGHYFLPRQLTAEYNNPNKYYEDIKLEAAIENKLKSIIPKSIRFVDTTQYDAFSGNLHCATQNISVSCSQN